VIVCPFIMLYQMLVTICDSCVKFLSLARLELVIAMMRVISFGRRCGKSSPSVAEQPFVIETCNFGHICAVI